MADYRLPFTGEQVEEILATATPQSSLTQEIQRATEAEGQLQSNINQEAETRGNADRGLQQNINTEAETRGQADLALQQLIQQVQASLINYYLKTETYSANQIDAMLAAIKQFRYQVVDVLPTPSAETMGIIYLVPSAHAVSGNIKDEYITLTRDEGSGIIYYFEQIGETAIDLSNYYTKAQTNAEISAAINAALAVYSTTAEMNTAIAQAIATAIANYYTKSQTDALIANFITASVNNLVNYYLKSETYTQAEVNALIAAVHQFTYQSVTTLPTASADTMNKIYLVPSTNPETKNVKDEYITIATTDQGTTTYSWEQIGTTTVDLSGYSTTEQMNAAIANAIATALANYYTKSQTMTSAEIEAAISAALLTYSTTTEMNTAISNAINTALASYSTTSQMTAAIATAIANYYTKAEVDALIANFITKSVNDLVNYYLKSDTYTKAEVQQLIDAVKQFTYQSVAELPTASADTMNKIYLVPSTNPETKNVKDEYITIAVTDQGTTTYSWEQIGSTTVDLSGYYTSAQTDAAISAALAAYSTTTQMQSYVAGVVALYYTKTEVDALIANFITKSVNDLVNYYLKSDTYTKAEVQQLIDAVKQFTYVSGAELPTASADTMNKIYLVPSTNPETKNVKDEYITIAVTDQGTTTYSWEQIGSTTVDLSGYYTSQQTDAAISNALNTALASYSTTSQMTAAIATAIANYYTKAEVDALIANFITKSVNDLVNYYLKSDTYTKAEVQQLIDAVKQFIYVSVAELPTASVDTMNKIYLVPSANPQTRNVKDEYITIAVTDQGTTTYSWEQIGTTTIDLSGYYTSAQTDAAINTALSAYSTTSQMNAAIAAAVASYYTKTEVDALIANFITKAVSDLTYYYLKSETYNKTEVDAMVAAIQQFQLISVQTLPTASADTMNKIYLVPGTDPQTQNVKDEYITLEVTDQGTTIYSWECIGSTEISLDNYYTKSQTDNAISGAITLALADYSTTSQVGTMISMAINSALAAYATKEYVSSQVQEYAGTFRGTYTSLADLQATTGNHHNDYAWVQVTDSDGDNDYDRYKYNGSEWVFEYRLNNTHFSAAELASIQSGMTTAKREKLDALPTNSELTTKINALTRRTRLSDFDLATLKLAVADQNLEKYGLKVGDYKTINGHDYVIAGLNPMKGTSTPYRLTINHVGLIVIPHTTQKWNESGNTYTGADSRGAGYLNSDLHYYLKNTLLPLVETDLGAANLLGHSKLLTNTVNQNGYNRFGEAIGCSSGWTWDANCKICALSEVQVYGSTVWSSSGYDTGEACRQLDVFRHYNHTEIFGGEYPWLRDVVSASLAAIANNYGSADYDPASYALYVAALILFN